MAFSISAWRRSPIRVSDQVGGLLVPRRAHVEQSSVLGVRIWVVVNLGRYEIKQWVIFP